MLYEKLKALDKFAQEEGTFENKAAMALIQLSYVYSSDLVDKLLLDVDISANTRRAVHAALKKLREELILGAEA
jgi:hypothetical protein